MREADFHQQEGCFALQIGGDLPHRQKGFAQLQHPLLFYL